MRKHLYLIPGFLLLFFCASCTERPILDSRTKSLLGELDGYLRNRSMYDARKIEQMEALSRLASTTVNPQMRFDVELNIAREYFAFSFDSTQTRLKRCQDIAMALGDNERFASASILLGHLYAKAGNYMEAHDILYDRIDSTALSDALKVDYYMALYDFSRDLSGNSGMVERLSIEDRDIYRQRLYKLVPPDSKNWRLLRMDELIGQGRLESADSICRAIISTTDPESHEFAIYAFEKSEISERMGRSAERLEWLIRSAECDAMNSVKDYASLTMVAQIILPADVDRSFSYLRIAQEDALFYNAKLRPWQISRFLLEVENAYSQRQQKQTRIVYTSMALLALLAVILSILTYLYLARSRKLARSRAALEKSNTDLALANASLEQMNRQISKADKVKEDYILSFLESLSGQIATVRAEDNHFRNLLKQGKADRLMKELSIQGRSEKTREEFYNTFDKTILGLFPDFVEQFNALLKEEGRVYPPKGRLTTELRVFALIRLGVDDSKKIAAMLDYSPSTIYNHKVTVKNNALGNRDDFEHRVKQIGR